MTTAKEQFKNDLHKSPEDLEREADGVRADLEGKVDQLMHQLSPSQLLNQGISYFRNSGYYDFVRNIATRLEANPIPTVLAGVGLVWLMTASRQPSMQGGGGFAETVGDKAGATRDKLSSATNSLKSSTQDAAERTRDAGHQAAERARDAGHKVAEGASDVMHRVSDAGRQTAESARSGFNNAREGYTQMLREQPLLVGALAVVAGATLGALLPRTPVEDRLMGQLSDRGTDALKERTGEKLKEAQGKIASESEDSAEESAGSAPSATVKSKPAAGSSGEKDSPSGKGAAGQSQPPPRNPPSPGANRGSSQF